MKYNYHYGPLGHLAQITDDTGQPVPAPQLIDCNDPHTQERG